MSYHDRFRLVGLLCLVLSGYGCGPTTDEGGGDGGGGGGGGYFRWALVDWYWYEVIFEVVLLAEPDQTGALQIDNDTSREIVTELCPSPEIPPLDLTALDFEETSQYVWCQMAWGQDGSATLEQIRSSCQTNGAWEGCDWLWELSHLVEGGVPFTEEHRGDNRDERRIEFHGRTMLRCLC